MNTKGLAIIFSIFIFFFVIELIRRERITFKYAVYWLFMSLLAVVFAAFDKLLYKLAQALGFILPSNFIFFLIGIIFVFSSLIFTVFLCQQNSHMELIAQKLAILEAELIKIKDKS